ncbi:MAG: hypothetical protein SPL70_02610, partial [Cyanobacteriota bacterium]|nr:hypothetical protein [Cyanobacteriota bacterium]
FTGFFQTMFRNGGRNGVALSAGFRWALGKDPNKVSENNVILSDSEESPKLTKTTVQKVHKTQDLASGTKSAKVVSIAKTEKTAQKPATQTNNKVSNNLSAVAVTQVASANTTKTSTQKTKKAATKVKKAKRSNGFIAKLKNLTNRHNTAKVNSARPVARVQTVAPVQTSSGARVIKQLTPNQKQHLEYTIKTQMKAVVNKL